MTPSFGSHLSIPCRTTSVHYNSKWIIKNYNKWEWNLLGIRAKWRPAAFWRTRNQELWVDHCTQSLRKGTEPGASNRAGLSKRQGSGPNSGSHHGQKETGLKTGQEANWRSSCCYQKTYLPIKAVTVNCRYKTGCGLQEFSKTDQWSHSLPTWQHWSFKRREGASCHCSVATATRAALLHHAYTARSWSWNWGIWEAVGELGEKMRWMRRLIGTTTQVSSYTNTLVNSGMQLTDHIINTRIKLYLSVMPEIFTITKFFFPWMYT